MSAPGGKIREEIEEVNQTISQVNPQNQSLRKHKTKHTINIRQIFRVSPINPLKEHIRQEHAGIIDHSV